MWRLLLLIMLCCNNLLLDAAGIQRQQQQQQRNNKAATQRRIQPRETNNCESRQTAGPICESCELLSTCVRHSNGWVNIPVESCDVQNGYYCNSRLGKCSNATGPCHPFGIEGNFQCTSQGFYPDPYDCQKYHMCYFVGPTLVAANVECGNDKAFDAHTGQCSLTLQSSVCQQRQYDCPSVGYVAPWPSNPNIFYVCKSTVKENTDDNVVLYPSLHRCADGEFFDDYHCRSVNLLTNTTTTTTVLPPQPDEDPNDPLFGMQTALQQRCQHIGLTADPSDCHKYFYCSIRNGTMRHLECPLGTHYSNQMAACVLGTCNMH